MAVTGDVSGEASVTQFVPETVLHMTRAMAAEYIKYGIRVNSVSPGVVLSGIHDNAPLDIVR